MTARLADAFDDAALRFRPYATDRNRFEEYRKERLAALETVLAAKGIFSRRIFLWAQETLDGFSALAPRAFSVRFPLVLYAGEIYMRQHDPYAVRDPHAGTRRTRSRAGPHLGVDGLCGASRGGEKERTGPHGGEGFPELGGSMGGPSLPRDHEGPAGSPLPETVLSRIEEADIFSRHITGESLSPSASSSNFSREGSGAARAAPRSAATFTWDPSLACRKESPRRS
jgi:hypothetical protein